MIWLRKEELLVLATPMIYHYVNFARWVPGFLQGVTPVGAILLDVRNPRENTSVFLSLSDLS
ncbi:hypothetical protein [Paenibacillus sanguinis]|uniref:hypothetical protein n=1 Tax=Paenibacillus sanguinis TaxID=225906 RepID=UPI0012B50A5B|nr:hypothetical protein [Paenibacillus sanguinis]